MSEREAFYTVDRIEGDVAVLVGDEGVALDVRRTTLPVRTEHGMVLRVPLSDWARLVELHHRRR